ncbi:MAG: hypothetical protein C3F12_00155 [Candidatus Methylomirabilota bacterium]|nr:MAG: hypothetical protein C3F12_00155 [candidate division NC10 bacterium]
MTAKVEGQVVAVVDDKTKEGKAYRVITVLQVHEKGADLVRLRSWNGLKADIGKPISVVVRIEAYQGKRGVGLSVDAFEGVSR